MRRYSLHPHYIFMLITGILIPSLPLAQSQQTTPPPVPASNTAPAANPAANATPTPAAGGLPIAPTQQQPAPDTEKAKPHTSMGNSGLSIFFTPLQIRAMEAALREFESKPISAPKSAASLEVDLMELQKNPSTEKPGPIEPEHYPVFYLSSIAFKDKKEWSLWISGHKITSSKNTTDLQVSSVSESQAHFTWKPKFNQALSIRAQQKAFAPVEAHKTKLSVTQPFSYDAESGTITFTLKPNQTFNVGYMSIFEGFLDSPNLPKLEMPSAKNETGGPITAPDTALLQTSDSPTNTNGAAPEKANPLSSFFPDPDKRN